MEFDLKQLRQIVMIAETGNFARAAESLSISQPALSRSVQSLEHRVGSRLFDRGRGGVTPTPAGAILLGHAHALLKQAAEVEREMTLLLGRGAGHLKLGAGPFPAAISVGSAIARLTREFPDLSVDVQVGDWDVLTRQVLETELDLAIAELPPSEPDDRLRIERLPQHRGRYFCRSSHPLTRTAKLHASDLLAYPMAMTILPTRLQNVGGRKRSAPKRRQDGDRALPWIHVNTFDLAKQIVVESDAIGLAVPDQIAKEVKAGVLAILDIDVAGLHTNYGIITLAGRTLAPAAETFMQILREVEAAIVARTSARPAGRRSRAGAARPT